MSATRTARQIESDLEELRSRHADAEQAAAQSQSQFDLAEEAYADADERLKATAEPLAQLLKQIPGDNALDRWMNDGAMHSPVNPAGYNKDTLDIVARSQILQREIEDARAEFRSAQAGHQTAHRARNAATKTHTARQKKLADLATGIGYHEQDLAEAREREADAAAQRSTIRGRLSAAFGADR